MDRLSQLINDIGQSSQSHADGSIDAATFLEHCTRLVAEHVDCARTGIWQFIDAARDRRVLRCLGIFDRSIGRMVMAADADDAGAYFLALSHTGYINATDVASHFATSACFADGAGRHPFKSLLAASLVFDGRIFGVLTCTEVDRPVEWSGWQLNAARKAASHIAVAMYGRLSPCLKEQGDGR